MLLFLIDMKRYVLLLFSLFYFQINLISKDILIIYDGERGKSEAFKSAMFIYNLLDHFSINSKEVLNVRDYKEGMVFKKDLIFVDFEEGFPEFEDLFISDLIRFEKEIVWINMHIDRFLDRTGERFGIEFEDFKFGKDWKVFYKGEDFPKEDPGMNLIKIKDKKNVNLLSSAMDENGRYFPYVIKTNNLWYFADSPFSFANEGGRFLILADLLHEILREYHSERHLALLRIEDVGPEDNPSFLKKIASFLSKEDIPFQISLIPFYKNPEEQYESRLSQKPSLVQAIRFMVNKGGTVVLHGATHQLRGVSAEDYEFWDDISGKPVSNESPDWVEERIKLALSECIKNGIYPLAWETPHYSGSRNVYTTISKYFTTFNDRIMAVEISGTQQIFPYESKLKDFNIFIVPENLGYVDIKNPEPEKIIQNAKNMLVVRDGIASFFFHSFVPLKHLKKIVKEMKKMGWKFVSLKDFPSEMRTDYCWVTSREGEGKIHLRNQYIHEILMDRKGKIIREYFSTQRQNGIFTKKIHFPPGYLYVAEGVDSLPEKKIGLRNAISEKIQEILKKDKNEILRFPTILLIKNPDLKGTDRFDQDSFESVFKVFGFTPVVINKEKILETSLRDFTIVCVPYTSANK